MQSPPKIGILVGPRGRGSNMRAIVEASRDGRIDATCMLVSPKPETPAVEWAMDNGVETHIVAYDEPYGARLLEVLGACNLVCLAGYLRLLPTEMIQAFPNAILNIHPALLPKFGGKGMYGIHVHEAVLASGERESGCTVHYVTERYDEGEIVVQLRCPVEPDDTPESLAARVLQLEHQAYVQAIREHFARKPGKSDGE